MNTQVSTSAKRSAREQFDRQAEHYNAQWNTWSEETLVRLVEMAEPKATDILLDVATGTGFTALEFAPLVARVVAVDVSTGMLDVARRQATERGIENVEFAVSPAEKLPFADGSFDIVTCRIAAHHFVSVSDFVRESARVLRPGGRFALVDTTVPDGDAEAAEWQNSVEALRDPSHARNLSPCEWRSIVESAGLVVETVVDTGGGITVPLEDWIHKAGCTPDQSADVRRRFAEAPESCRRAFRIEMSPEGGIVFTWRRVLLKATRPVL